ncbi:MAG: hypothetical protein IJK04_13760 [Kiritimatiellae bacterium]|nr:hypothetical protein [Kiritimatiellia bacterium]
MKAGRFFITSVAAAMLLATARADEKDFVAQAKEKGVTVVGHEFPAAFAPEDFKAEMTVKNAGELALRGSLVVETVDEAGKNPRQIGKADLDMPPSTMGDIEQNLVVKGKMTTFELGRTARIVLKVADKGDVICFSAPVAEKADAAKKRKDDAAKATSSAGGRHDIRYATRLPEGEGEAYRAFLEAGGVLIVRLVESKDDYAGAAVFCGTNALPAFKPQKGPAHSYDNNVNAGGTPLFDWPNNISGTLAAGDGRLSLPGEAGKKWETVQNNYTVLHRVGKGVLIVSCHTVEDTKELRENIARQLKLEEDGIRFAGFRQDFDGPKAYMGKYDKVTPYGGKTIMKVKNLVSTNLNLAARLTVSEVRKGGESRTFVERKKPSTKIGEVLSFDMQIPRIDLCGKCHVKAEIFEWGGKKSWVMEETDVDFPEFFEAVPPHFRSIVSTGRSQADVLIGLKFNRHEFDADGTKWKAVAKNAKGAVVAEASGVFGKGESAIDAALPVPQDAPAGEYTVEAEATLPCGAKASAKCAFSIVAPEPGQVIVDQDGFLLNEGKPFFPLGIYHMHTFNLNDDIGDSGFKAKDMGFNWMTLWDWDWKNHVSLDPKVVDPFIKKEFQGEERQKELERVLEENRNHRKLIKEMGAMICMEIGGIWNNVITERRNEKGLYTYEARGTVGKDIEAIGNDPDHLLRMWYLADEGNGFYQSLGRASEFVKKHDKNLHPTFNLGDVATATSGDFGGNDIYVRYYGGLGQASAFAGRIDAIRKEMAPLRRRPFIVPQAFGQSEKQPEETPEWVRVEAYLACIHGASGIGFYCWKQTGDWTGAQKQGMGWNPPTALEVKKLVAEIKVFADALSIPGEKFFKSKDGNVHALLFGNEKTGRFLIAANLFEGAVKTDLKAFGLDGAKLEPLFGSPAAKVRDGLMPIALPQWGTAAWRVK